jgi:hypothetical protein
LRGEVVAGWRAGLSFCCIEISSNNDYPFIRDLPFIELIMASWLASKREFGEARRLEIQRIHRMRATLLVQTGSRQWTIPGDLSKLARYYAVITKIGRFRRPNLRLATRVRSNLEGVQEPDAQWSSDGSTLIFHSNQTTLQTLGVSRRKGLKSDSR